mgnify:CR=1 FL=1
MLSIRASRNQSTGRCVCQRSTSAWLCLTENRLWQIIINQLKISNTRASWNQSTWRCVCQWSTSAWLCSTENSRIGHDGCSAMWHIAATFGISWMRFQDFNALLWDWICQTRFDRRHKTKGKAKLFQEEATFYGFCLHFLFTSSKWA